MNEQKAKKWRQQYRRDVRRGVLLEKLVKQKPKIVPMKLWLWGAKIFIKVDKIEKW